MRTSASPRCRSSSKSAEGAGPFAVIVVPTPILSGSAAAILLLVGYGLRLAHPLRAMGQTLIPAGRLFAGIAVVGIVIAETGLLLTSLRETARPTGTAGNPPSATSRRTQRGAAEMASLATRIAGPERGHLRQEWLAHLAGAAHDGLTLSP